MVQSQSLNGGPSDGRQASQSFSIPGEVLCPSIAARVEEANHIAALGIDPGEIRSFEVVTVKTSEGQIARRRFAAVRLRDDVIELKRGGDQRGWEQTILATKMGAETDKLLKGRIHSQASAGRMPRERRPWISSDQETSQAA